MKRLFVVVILVLIGTALVANAFALDTKARATDKATDTKEAQSKPKEMTIDGFVLKPHHAAVFVKNLDESIKWYKDMLGYEEALRLDMTGGKMKIAFLKNGNWFLELFEVNDTKGGPEKHFAFQVEGLEKFHELLASEGVEIVRFNSKPPRPTLFIRDNAGNLIEFIEVDHSQPHYVK